jgi:hypothetical protein
VTYTQLLRRLDGAEYRGCVGRELEDALIAPHSRQNQHQKTWIRTGEGEINLKKHGYEPVRGGFDSRNVSWQLLNTWFEE